MPPPSGGPGGAARRPPGPRRRPGGRGSTRCRGCGRRRSARRVGHGRRSRGVGTRGRSPRWHRRRRRPLGAGSNRRMSVDTRPNGPATATVSSSSAVARSAARSPAGSRLVSMRITTGAIARRMPTLSAAAQPSRVAVHTISVHVPGAPRLLRPGPPARPPVPPTGRWRPRRAASRPARGPRAPARRAREVVRPVRGDHDDGRHAHRRLVEPCGHGQAGAVPDHVALDNVGWRQPARGRTSSRCRPPSSRRPRSRRAARRRASSRGRGGPRRGPRRGRRSRRGASSRDMRWRIRRAVGVSRGSADARSHRAGPPAMTASDRIQVCASPLHSTEPVRQSSQP